MSISNRWHQYSFPDTLSIQDLSLRWDRWGMHPLVITKHRRRYDRTARCTAKLTEFLGTLVINIFCQHCEVSTRVPLRTHHTLHNIIALAEPGGGIWLDNMSINQSDIDDVNSQLAVMGDIYGGAECVSVLLPSSDQEAYRTITDLVERAAILLKRKGNLISIPKARYGNKN
jgi:hypothetical protein